MPRSNQHFDDASYASSSGEDTFSAAETTPSHRAMLTSTPQDAKRRVDVATQGLTKTRCLITNVECDTATDYAHVLARAVEGQAVVSYVVDSFATA